MSEYEEDKKELKNKKQELIEMKDSVETRLEQLGKQLDQAEDAIKNINAKLEYIAYRENKEGYEKQAKPVEEELEIEEIE